MIEGYSVIAEAIAEGQSLSGAIDVSRVRHVVKLHMPAAWTGDTITFQVSPDGEVWRDLFTFPRGEPSISVSVSTGEGGGSSAISDEPVEREVSIKVGASQAVPVSGLSLAGEAFLKIRSGTKGAPVAQPATRIVKLIAVEEPLPADEAES